MGVLGDIIDMTSNNTLVSRNETCVAYRLHSTFLESDFDHDAAIGELVTLQVVPYVAIVIACIISSIGHMILRPSVIVLGFCVGSMSTLHLFYEYASVLHNWDCNTVAISSFVVGGIFGFIGDTVMYPRFLAA